MKKESSRRSNLLLMEIILAVLFFSVASTICLQMFVRASLLSREAEELDKAVRCVCSAAELLSLPGPLMERVQDIYPEAQIEETDAYIWFSEDFEICQESDAAYQMVIRSYEQDTRTTAWSAALYRSPEEEEVYRLEGTTYQQRTLPAGQ